MANEIYSKSWWGSGVCDNDVNWGLVYKPYASCEIPREKSFIEKFGEPESGYSLRNLTSNPEQYVIQVINKELETFDLLETQINETDLLPFGTTLRVVKWYDQAGGSNETLTAATFNAPYIIKDKIMFFQNRKPTIYFANQTQLSLITEFRPRFNSLQSYNVSSYSPRQEPGQLEYNILKDVGRPPGRPLIQLLPSREPGERNSFKSIYSKIIQNGISYTGEDGFFREFESDPALINLYSVPGALTSPINFMLGNTTEMFIAEFILYKDLSLNQEEVTENIMNYYL